MTFYNVPIYCLLTHLTATNANHAVAELISIHYITSQALRKCWCSIQTISWLWKDKKPSTYFTWEEESISSTGTQMGMQLVFQILWYTIMDHLNETLHNKNSTLFKQYLIMWEVAVILSNKGELVNSFVPENHMRYEDSTICPTAVGKLSS